MDEPPTPTRIPGPIDLRRTERTLGSAVGGYGLTPSSARERAALVRAVTQDGAIRQRPMPVVIATALIALVGLVIWGWQLYGALSESTALTPLFWAGLATFIGAAAVCSWAWQLYDVRKAIVMWLAIVVLGLAAVLIIAVVLVAAKGDGDADLDLDLDGLLGKITGPVAPHGGGFVDHVVAPLVLDTLEAADQGTRRGPDITRTPTYAPVPAATSPSVAGGPPVPACPTCGRPITAGLLICPRCGTRLG